MTLRKTVFPIRARRAPSEDACRRRAYFGANEQEALWEFSFQVSPRQLWLKQDPSESGGFAGEMGDSGFGVFSSLASELNNERRPESGQDRQRQGSFKQRGGKNEGDRVEKSGVLGRLLPLPVGKVTLVAQGATQMHYKASGDTYGIQHGGNEEPGTPQELLVHAPRCFISIKPEQRGKQPLNCTSRLLTYSLALS